MGQILLVVADGGNPTSGDIFLRTTLEALGHSVNYISTEAAENVSGFDGVVIAESVTSATLGSKYSTVAIPLVNHEPGYLDDMGFCLTANIQQLGTQTQVIWVETEPIADGPFGAFSGTDTIFSSSVTIGAFDNTGGTASGVVEIATSAAGTSSVCAIAERGATLHIGAAAERRVFIWPHDAASASLNADGLNAVKNAYAWAFEERVGRRRYQRLYGPAQLDTSATDLYTVPAGVRTRVRRIYVNNPTGSPVTVTIQVDS